jgi:hypothetical protein
LGSSVVLDLSALSYCIDVIELNGTVTAPSSSCTPLLVLDVTPVAVPVTENVRGDVLPSEFTALTVMP